MPSLTEAMTSLANSIMQQRHERATDAAARRAATHDRVVAVMAQLGDTHAARAAAFRDYQAAATAEKTQRTRDTDAMLAQNRRGRMARQRHRQEMAAAQQRQLAAFMTGLTADVDAMRAGFVADLEGQRAALRVLARGVEQKLDAARRDREGAGEVFRGRRPAAAPAPARTPHAPARHEPARHEPARPGPARAKPAEHEHAKPAAASSPPMSNMSGMPPARPHATTPSEGGSST